MQTFFLYRLDEGGKIQGVAFARSSHPKDEMFTVNFNEHVWNGLPESMPFTTDTAQLQNALDQSTARGQTALFDGVRAALKHFADGHEQKKVLIVVSDGGDNASTSKFSDVLDMALRMDAVIYATGMYDQYDRDAKPDVLRKLAKSTGGVAYFPHDPGDATKILEEIARDIRSGYTVQQATTAFHQAAMNRELESMRMRPPTAQTSTDHRRTPRSNSPPAHLSAVSRSLASTSRLWFVKGTTCRPCERRSVTFLSPHYPESRETAG
jgi:VWFA-related protein